MILGRHVGIARLLGGLRRLVDAVGYSRAGLAAAWQGEEAFRQEVLAGVLLVPLALWLGRSPLERLLLVATWVLVMIVEILNTAVEATVDRFGEERHLLSGRLTLQGRLTAETVAFDSDATLVIDGGLILRQVGGYGLPDALRMTVGSEEANRLVVGALRERTQEIKARLTRLLGELADGAALARVEKAVVQASAEITAFGRFDSAVRWYSMPPIFWRKVRTSQRSMRHISA